MGRWGYGPLTVVFSSSFSSLSFTFGSLPDIFFVFFELKSISGLRTRPRTTGNRVQLTLPFLPPSVSRCEVEVGQPAQVNSRTEKGVVVHCGGGHLLICCSITTLSPVVHLDWFPNNKYFSLVLNSYIYPILLFHQKYFFH